MLCVSHTSKRSSTHSTFNSKNIIKGNDTYEIEENKIIITETLRLKGRMILRCVKKAISYKCPYVVAVVVPYQIYTVVMMTICANQENNIV